MPHPREYILQTLQQDTLWRFSRVQLFFGPPFEVLELQVGHNAFTVYRGVHSFDSLPLQCG
jgi:hypothetical protein